MYFSVCAVEGHAVKRYAVEYHAVHPWNDYEACMAYKMMHCQVVVSCKEFFKFPAETCILKDLNKDMH